MEYLAKVRLLCDKRQTLIIKYANIMGGKKRSNSMQTTYPCIKTNRGRHHDIPGHTKTKIKLMVSNLSYAAACSSLDLHCKGRALRPSLQSPTLGIFRSAPPCRPRRQTTMGKAYGPTADGIRCCRPWHTTPPGIAPYATAMALHPTGQVASCSIPIGEVAWSKLRMPYGQVSLLYDYMEASFSISPVCCVIPAFL